MSWVRPDREILPDLPHTQVNAQLYDADMVVVSRKLGREGIRTHRVLNPGTVVCESFYALRSPTTASCPDLIDRIVPF